VRRPDPLLVAVGVVLLTVACATRTPSAPPPVRPEPTATADASAVAHAQPVQPVLPPQAAHLLGLLPRRTIGVERFLAEHQSFDGRGVLIGIMDSGIDPGVPGLQRTTTGEPKLADLRDFSGEGRVALERTFATGDAILVAGRYLHGFGRVAALSVGPYYGGTLEERALGPMPAADVNGDGDRKDALPVVVARASDGWFLMADTDGDGSLADEHPVRDFAVAGDTFTYGPLTIAANFATEGGSPVLDLYFDTAGHGTHVAGIAAGHDLFGVAGFDGIAPGARILGLKIANDARGGISVTASMVRAMTWAADYAARRRLPLVLNLSFGIGNAPGGGRAIIDSVVDAFELEHPEVPIVISAGNDGPGIATVGLPGSADFALSACALFPGVFAQAPNAPGPPAPDVLGWWSSRGGRRPKPDLCVPGVAFSNVPRWQTGDEVAAGTSMAAPELSGAVELLQSALAADGYTATNAELATALRATASPIDGATTIDMGAGIPDVTAAYRWLRAGHRAGWFTVSALPDGDNTGLSAAYRRSGLAPGDTLQRFTVVSRVGQPFAQVLLRSDATWLHTPSVMDFTGEPATVTLTYDRDALHAPGLYVGTVWARPASDTLAGAAFGLTNTVVVPYDLSTPLSERRFVPRGRVERFFLRVPPDAGGLDVRATVGDPEQAVSLYLFEPSGQPQRDVSSVEVGGTTAASSALLVRAEDLVPGVYEAALVAPPTRSATVDFAATVSPLRLAEEADGARVTNGSGSSIDGHVAQRLLGAARTYELRGKAGEVARARVSAPPWATTLQLDVTFEPALWPHITDVGVSVWDSAGYFAGEEALDFPFGRHRMMLPSAGPRTFDVEVMPAFALPDDHTAWGARVMVVFLRADSAARADTVPLALGPGASTSVPWSQDTTLVVPGGFDRFVEVAASVGGEVASMLRTRVPASTAMR
jgi:subtilisin family serine protease